jgi:phosphoserine phosphatase RsbU/P
MADVQLEVTDSAGRRVVGIDKAVFTIGRRTENDLCVSSTDVSRDHAEIVCEGQGYVIRDRSSRFGTFVNGAQVSECALKHGDIVRLGRSGGVEMVFLAGGEAAHAARPATTLVSDLRHLGSLLDGLRALGSGRVLDDVLALVIDSAIEVGSAERGFIMLANAKGELEFKLARSRGRVTLPGKVFETSRKIPHEVFDTGEPRVVADLLDGDLADAHLGTIALGIRQVLCVPLNLVRYLDEGEAVEERKRIGVLYLDSREKGVLLSSSGSQAVETLAAEAAVAIDNARLYRQAIEKARLEEELKIAAQIQQALLPRARRAGTYFDAIGSNLPCLAIGGDFFDYVDLASGEFGFALADVAGKGAPAALLAAVLQGSFDAQASFGVRPAETMVRLNKALVSRAFGSRFATMFYAVVSPEGRLTYSNAGHNPPFLLRAASVERLTRGGLILGLFETAAYEEETLTLGAGDTIVLFSDGVSEALDTAGTEFGEDRILACAQANQASDPPHVLEQLLAAVKEFSAGTMQHDDVTALVVRFLGSGAPQAGPEPPLR